MHARKKILRRKSFNVWLPNSSAAIICISMIHDNVPDVYKFKQTKQSNILVELNRQIRLKYTSNAAIAGHGIHFRIIP